MESSFLEQCKRNYNLQALNTLAIPSTAEYFLDVATESSLIDTLEFIHHTNCPLTILGGGSNVLLSDKILGLVVKLSTQGRRVVSETDTDMTIRFDAGENWHGIVLWSANNNLYGIENLALIPGTIGAAPIQNIGAYGVELTSCLESVEGFYISSSKRFTLTNKECLFAYRDSIFKQGLRNQVMITHVTLKLSKIPTLQIDYLALKEQLEKNKTPLNSLRAIDVAKAIIEIRQSKLPDPLYIPNAGSFFKNPVVDEKTYKKIQKEYPNIVAYSLANSHYKLAAGWLLDQAGWRGKIIDNICMHEKQALVLTNINHCSSREILLFVHKVCESIQQKFGVMLEIEPTHI